MLPASATNSAVVVIKEPCGAEVGVRDLTALCLSGPKQTQSLHSALKKRSIIDFPGTILPYSQVPSSF